MWNMHVKYFNGIKIGSKFKIVLFRVVYNTLLETFHEKQGDRHKEASMKKTSGIILKLQWSGVVCQVGILCVFTSSPAVLTQAKISVDITERFSLNKD